MKPLFKNLLVLGCGWLACGVVISLVQFLSHTLFPLPQGFDFYGDPEMVRNAITLPMMLMLELSYILGSFVGGFVIGKYGATHKLEYAGFLGALFTLVNVFNILAIPHPVWLIVLTSLTFVPMTLFGCMVAQGKKLPFLS